MLWDESFLWGLIAWRTFMNQRVNFDIFTAADVNAGMLDGYDVLFVPGGWASDKIEALGNEGAGVIRDFVTTGGSYLGFCGGSGLALSHDTGLGLVPVQRMPTGDRLPSFSGTIKLDHISPGHPIWSGVEPGLPYHAWWPGQFSIDTSAGVTVLAGYGEPDIDAFVTDVPVSAVVDWRPWEESYGINLDPSRIIGEPAVIEAAHGSGRVLLSYIHFETPGDEAGYQVLLNMLGYLSGGKQVSGSREYRGDDVASAHHTSVAHDDMAAGAAISMENEARDFYRFGQENLLWYRRRDWLLCWRRGIRGIEFSTLDAMIREISEYGQFTGGFDGESNQLVKALAPKVMAFYRDARALLMLERLAMNRGALSPLKCDDDGVQGLREKLFSAGRRCGGQYRSLVEQADTILLRLLRRQLQQ